MPTMTSDSIFGLRQMFASSKRTRAIMDLPTRLGDDSQLLCVLLALSVVGAVLYLRSAPENRKLQDGAVRPPHVWAWIPWLGSGLALGKDPDGFLTDAGRTHGPIFSARVAGRKMIFITSPAAIGHIYKKAKTFVFYKFRREIAIHAFGQSREIDGDHFQEQLFPMIDKKLLLTDLASMVDDFGTYMEDLIQKKRDSMSGEEIIGARRLIYDLIYDASGKSVCGPDFIPVSQFQAFIEFDKGFPLLAGEFPAWMTRSVRAHREKAIQQMIEWYRHADKSKIPDPVRAMQLYMEDIGADERDVVVVTMEMVFATMANAPHAGVWAIVRFAENPKHLARLREEIAAGLAQADGDLHKLLHTPSVFNSPTFAFLTSAIEETLRETTSVFSLRRVQEDTVIPAALAGGKDVGLRAGDDVFCVTRSAHIDPDIYDRPLEWIPDRFLKRERRAANEYMPWGGGVSMCTGRNFAMQELRLLLIAFFATFDATPLSSEPAKVSMTRGAGSGVMWLDEGYKLKVVPRSM